MAFFEFDDEIIAAGPDEFPVYRHLGRKCWLYMNQKRQWCINDKGDMFCRASQGWAHSAAVTDCLCPMQSGGWRIRQDGAWKPASISISNCSSIELVVRSLAGEQLLREVYDPAVSIRTIRTELGYWKPGKRVRLSFRNRVLGDRVLLGSLGIEAGESLQAVFQDRRDAGGFYC